jgi:hypothetical protein
MQISGKLDMKLSFLVLISLFLLAGCQSSRSRDTANNSNAAVSGGTGDVSVADQKTESADGKITEKPEFKKMTFEAKNLPKGFAYEGKITGGARWMDASGENTLIVSEKTERGADFSTQKIFGYLYAVRGGDTKLVWKIQDFAENPCDSGKGLVSPVEVRDLDGDGVAENMFVYNVQGACDVSPISYKLMLHSGEKKLAIRGENAIDAPGIKEKGKKNFDEAFDSSPAEFRRAASEFWDKYVKPFKAE